LKEFDIKEETANVEIPESIRGERGVEEHLPLAYDSVATEDRKKEVLQCQCITAS